MSLAGSSAGSSQVEAVIIAGGFGTRLQPLTTRRPKHLLEVGGVPFLFHQLARLAEAGVEHVVLATSYHAEKFRPVLGDGERWGVHLDYVREEEPLGTAGAIRNAASLLDGDADAAVVVLNGDVLSGHDLSGQLDDFRTPRAAGSVDVSLHLVEVDDPRAFGSVPTEADGRVTAFLEKSDHPVSNQVNAGCYVFRRQVLDLIPPRRVVSVERETFPGLVAAGRAVVGFVDNAYWRDVGSPDALVAASRDLVLGIAPSLAVEAEPTGARIATTAAVDRTATVNGGSVVADHTRVGAGASVRGSVLMRGSEVGADAAVVDSVVGPGARVGAGVQLERATLGDEAAVGEGARMSPGERLDCGEVRTGAGR